MTFAVTCDERFASSLPYVRRRIEAASAVKCRLAHEDDDTTLTVDGIGFRSSLLDALADVIITDCKSFYINEKIRLPIKDALTRHAFTAALSTFDRTTDKIIAKTVLETMYNDGGVCNLSGIYEFCLGNLKSRWDEVVLLANENICYLVCQKTFNELLRFLISNIESISDEAHIIGNNGGFEVVGAGLTPIDEVYINNELPNPIGVVCKLIAIAPKKIYLHIQEPTLIGQIKNLFGTSTVISNLS